MLSSALSLDVNVATVEVTEGEESVLLPFNTKVHLPEDVTVEWRCSGSKHMVVQVYQRGNQPDQQDQDYLCRTEMKADLLETGDLSLTLKNPNINDRGVYTCTVYKDGKILRQKLVTLRVKGQYILIYLFHSLTKVLIHLTIAFVLIHKFSFSHLVFMRKKTDKKWLIG